jgi:hypothetical protein
MENKALWDQVKVTDPRAVKAITGKPYKGNSPKPYWLIERATEIFGPIGIGWGVDVVSERFERMSEHDVLHVAVVSVWYVQDGVRSQPFEQMGGTKACYMSKNGLIVDEDAGKKSVTDGMVKCLSMIGFAGDIFSGLWDDSKYIDWAAEKFADKRTPQQEEERSAWLEDQFIAIDAAKTTGELRTLVDLAISITRNNNDADAERQILAARDAKAAKAKRPEKEMA